MNDAEKIRSVVARFFNVPESDIGEAYVFPRERLQGSADRSTLHAALKRMAGVDLQSAFTANTYSQLLNGGGASSGNGQASKAPVEAPNAASSRNGGHSATRAGVSVGMPAVGIDLQQVEDLPAFTDVWAEPFYLENFSKAEIAYCTRQTNPRNSLCGLWCAKEAAIKCGLEFVAGLKPRDIEIFHTETGKPEVRLLNQANGVVVPEFIVCITHSKSAAAAVCLACSGSQPSLAAVSSPSLETNAMAAPRNVEAVSGNSGGQKLVWMSLLLSGLAILLWLYTLIGHK